MRMLIIAGHPDSLCNFRGDLIKALVSRGVEVHAAAPALHPQSSAGIFLEKLKVVIHEIPLSRAGINPLKDIRAVFSIFNLVRAVKPDSIFAYTVKPVVYGLIVGAFCRVKNRYALISGLGYGFIEGSSFGIRWLIRRLLQKLYRLALYRATYVFFQNPDDLELFRTLNIISPLQRVGVVNGSGVNIEAFKETPLPQGVVFLMIGRLLGDKGVREYADAARLLRKDYPEARFLLVGSIDENPNSIAASELQEWVEGGIIEYLGSVKDVRPAITQALVFVLPSYREGTPRTTLEAMAMGRPIITTDVPGCRETVVHGENGLLVQARSSASLMEAMRVFIEFPTSAIEMGGKSRALAVQKYDVRKINQQMLKVFGVYE